MKYERGVIVSVLALMLAVILYFLFEDMDTATRIVIRGGGLLGYFFLFLAIISSEYLTKMRKTFGRSFINVHHNFARIGVALILIHPITVAYQSGLDVLLPVLYPLMDFLRLGGRTALYLILIAVLAGVYRKKIPKKWKTVHAFNFFAFLLIFIHAWLIGTDLQNGVMQFLWLAMALVVVYVFFDKHIIPTNRKKKSKRPQGMKSEGKKSQDDNEQK
jgi:DMSO/TMAO reductase YedYZ heme-binding membrane subunit